MAAAWVARLDTPTGPHNASLAYPFDTFSMYAERTRPTASRILVRTEDGHAWQLTDFEVLACEPRLVLSASCPSESALAYVDDDLQHYLDDHPGVGAEPIDVIRRSFRLAPGEDAIHVEDCVMARCRGTR